MARPVIGSVAGGADFLQLVAELADFIDRRVEALIEPALLIAEPLCGLPSLFLISSNSDCRLLGRGGFRLGLSQVRGKRAFGFDDGGKRGHHFADHAVLHALTDMVDALAIVPIRHVFRADLLDRRVTDGDAAVQKNR